MNAGMHFLRNPRSIIVTGGEGCLMAGAEGGAQTHATRHGAAWSRLMCSLCQPLPSQELAPLAARIPDFDALWPRLIEDGHVLSGSDAEVLLSRRDEVFHDNSGFHFVPGRRACKHLVVVCTGSVVAGLLAPTLLSLSYAGFQDTLDVVLTAAAQRFVTRELLEAYGIRTWGDAFEKRDGFNVPHVQLGRSASCILVVPATANSLHRLAQGACSDLLSMMVAASAAPVVVAPAMNEAMWAHGPVQRNLCQLRDDGVYVIEPTLIIGAADVATQGGAMFGGHGSLWAGPAGLMAMLAAIIEAHAAKMRQGAAAAP